MLPPLSNTPILYADDGYLSHQVRLALLEKQIGFDEVCVPAIEVPLIDEDAPDPTAFSREDLADLNPYNTLPVLVVKELVLYHNAVIFEYLEERYPAYRLLPETPTTRAQYRQLMWRIGQDWLQLADVLLTHADTLDATRAQAARKSLTDSLVTLAPLFAHRVYFLSDTFGLCDCLLAPMLYRLPAMQITLPPTLCRPLLNYCARVFARPTFQASITTR